MGLSKKEKCKVCDEPTLVRFNIDFKAVPICEQCAARIFIQQSHSYVNKKTE